MRVAAIDIGTSSVLLLVAERQGDALLPVLERATVTRLGEGVDHNGRLLDTASERTLACLAEYAAELRRLGVTVLAAVGTSALRDAEGGQAFVSRAEATLGVAPRVIDGREEARLTFVGALSALPQTGPVTVFDIGGGSTEIITGSQGTTGEPQITAAVSLNIGCVRLFERHLKNDPPTADEVRQVEHAIAAALGDAPLPDADATLVGVAGTVTQLAALALELKHHDGARVHGLTLQRSALEGLVAHLASLDVAQHRALPGMDPARADVILVGGAIARAVLQWSGATELIVSDRGVRWGLAAELTGCSACSTP
jgi:exopolyphosphatase/guanosine-5'-triphosphate,3'-diphosphate pyrophosphatase